MRAAIRLALPLAALFALAAAPAFAQGQIIIINNNAPGVGFNDPTPAAPIGGNPGVTLGEQRLNVFNHAADIWEDALQPKNDILVRAQFVPLAAGVLGSAGTTFVFRNFPGAEYPDTWYHSALADQLAGVELNPGAPDINTNFSTNFVFYLGFDNNEGTLVDLLPVVLHELGHGLGFANFVNEATGTLFNNGRDIYSQYTLDVTTNEIWNEMTNSERAASAINVRKVSWGGIHVNADVPNVLSPGEPALLVTSPAGLGPFMVGTAGFGAPLSTAGVSGQLVRAVDPDEDGGGTAATSFDACSPLTNAAEVAGKIAVVDRGLCTFVTKVKNAQNAGAIAAIVADNAAGSPPAGLGGADPTITISSVRVTQADGNTIKANLAAGVQATLGLDLSVIAGTDRVQGKMMVAALNPVALGSSISHWDTAATRNQLMEPSINVDLTSSVRPPEDLTRPLMADIGWFSDADGVPDGLDSCLGSDIRPTVVIGGCDSAVPNLVFSNGCTITDNIMACAAGPRNHGGFVACVSHYTNDLKKDGWITGAQKGAIQSCAARGSN